jgi:hypothetical protein
MLATRKIFPTLEAMIKLFLLKVSLVCLVLLSGNHLFSQSDSICYPIMDAFLEKAGGREKISQIKSSRFVFKSHEQDDTTSITIIKVAGEKYFEQYMHGDFINELAYADGKLMQKVNRKVSRVKDPLVVERIQLQTYILPELAYPERGYTLLYGGVQNKHGKDYHVIRTRSPLQVEATLWYEKSSGYLREVINADESRVEFPSYASRHDMMVPIYLDTIYPGGKRLRFYLVDIAFDEEVDPSIFLLK